MLGILMVVLASAGIISYAMYGMMQRLNSLNRDTTKQQIYEAALTSYLNYTRAAIKRRWCFTSNWDQDSPLNCNLAHPYSTERLLISNEELDHINQVIASNPSFPHSNPIQLSGFEQTVDLSQLSPSHPLREIAASHEFGFLGKLHFSVSRMTDKDLPNNASTAYLRIQVDMIAKSGQSLPEGRSQMMGWAKAIVYQREIGSFALIVPNDLRLDGSSGIVGDASIVPTGNSSAAGLTFLSPVFVNGNIYVPPTPAVSYTPVTFTSQVVLGNGVLMRGGKPAVTSQAGGYQNQTYSSMAGFGGFLGGISIDGERDRGLDCYDGQVSCTAPNNNLMNQCIARAQLKANTDYTSSAALLIRNTGNNTFDLSWSSVYMTKFGLTDEDFFSPVDAQSRMKFSGNWATQPNLDNQNNAVMAMNITVQGTGQTISNAQMAREAVLTFSPQISGGSGHHHKGNQSTSGTTGTTGTTTTGGTSGSTESTSTSSTSTTPKQQPSVTIQTSSWSNNGAPQDNRVELNISVTNPDKVDFTFTVNIQGYDMAGAGTRKQPNNFSPNLAMTVSSVGGNTTVTPASGGTFSGSWQRADGGAGDATMLTVNDNWQYLEQVCSSILGPNPTNSFPASNWDVQYDMRSSWNLSFPGQTVGGIVDFNSSTDYSSAHVGIASMCDIHPSATRVVGFYVCDTLYIEGRSQPLKIFGTFIVKNLNIAPSALNQGIRWSTIYNTNAILDLRQKGPNGETAILHPMLDKVTGQPVPTATCDIDRDNPLWNPSMGIVQAMDSVLCNPLALRTVQKWDGMTWTTVDPDCGVDPNVPAATGATCKYHPVRFTILEYDRGFYL